MLITYIKGGTPAQIFLERGVCNDKGYIYYFLTEDEVGKFYWLMLLICRGFKFFYNRRYFLNFRRYLNN